MSRRCCCGCPTIYYQNSTVDFTAADAGDPPTTFRNYVDGTLGSIPSLLELDGKIKPTRVIHQEAFLIEFRFFGTITIEVEGYKITFSSEGSLNILDPDDVEVLDPGKTYPGDDAINEGSTADDAAGWQQTSLAHVYVCPTHLYAYVEDGTFSAMIVAEFPEEISPTGNWTMDGAPTAVFQDVSMISQRVEFAPDASETAHYDAGGHYTGGSYYYTSDDPITDCRTAKNYVCDFESYTEMKSGTLTNLPDGYVFFDGQFTGQFTTSNIPHVQGTGFFFVPGAAPGVTPNPSSPYYATLADITDDYHTQLAFYNTGSCGAGATMGTWEEDQVKPGPDNIRWYPGINAGASLGGAITYYFTDPRPSEPYPLPLFQVRLTAQANWSTSRTNIPIPKEDPGDPQFFTSISHTYVSTGSESIYIGINSMRDGFSMSALADVTEYTVDDPDGVLDNPDVNWGVVIGGEPVIYANAGASGTWSLF